MQFGLRVAFLLLLTGTVAVTGSDLPDNKGPNHKGSVQRAKRGFSIYDLFRGKGTTTVGTKTPKQTGDGFDLADALSIPDPNGAKPAEDGFGFNLEDALRPAGKPTDKARRGDCPRNMVQKLSTIIENQTQQLRLLQQLMARSPSSRFI